MNENWREFIDEKINIVIGRLQVSKFIARDERELITRKKLSKLFWTHASPRIDIRTTCSDPLRELDMK